MVHQRGIYFLLLWRNRLKHYYIHTLEPAVTYFWIQKNTFCFRNNRYLLSHSWGYSMKSIMLLGWCSCFMGIRLSLIPHNVKKKYINPDLRNNLQFTFYMPFANSIRLLSNADDIVHYFMMCINDIWWETWVLCTTEGVNINLLHLWRLSLSFSAQERCRTVSISTRTVIWVRSQCSR